VGCRVRRACRQPPRGAARRTTILGWNPDHLVDNQVTSLQFRRADESVVATAVNYGCHPVTNGYDMYVYSADFPGRCATSCAV